MNTMRKPILGLLIILWCYSCRDTNETTPSEPVGNLGLTIEEFPNQVGTVWTYVVDDSLIGRRDTVTVSVQRNPNPTESEFSTLWVTVRGNRRDTVLVVSSGNTVQFRDNQSQNFPEDYIFPLSIGNIWGTRPDVSSVISVDEVIVSKDTHVLAFHVKRRATSFNYNLSTDTWIARNVGIVKRHTVVYGLGPTAKEKWELLSLQLH